MHLQPTSVDTELTGTRRRSNVSGHISFRDDIRVIDQKNLARIKTTLSSSLRDGHEKSSNLHFELPVISIPEAAKSGPGTTIREVPSEYNSRYNSPLSTRPPSPAEGSRRLIPLQVDENVPNVAMTYPDIGSLSSWKGIVVLIVLCGAQ